MEFVVAGGGIAGLAAGLAVARSGHRAVVLERDRADPAAGPLDAFEQERRGIPHFFQPHAFLPRGRRELAEMAPDVLDDLLDAGADPQDLSAGLTGPPEPGDEDLVFLWARRPLIEWALRRAFASEPASELRSGVRIEGLVTNDNGGRRATGVALEGGERVDADVVVDALGRYRTPDTWHRAEAGESACGAVYYCRYFRLRDGVEHLEGRPQNPVSPRGDLGYMGFNTFRGDNRTYAVILLVPSRDRELRALKDERAWMAACASMRPLDVMTSPDYGEPITGVMPMGALANVDRTAEPEVAGMVAVGDAFCHTDPAFAYGLSFALAHARALGAGTAAGGVADEVIARCHAAIVAEARERYELACRTDDARSRRWRGEPLEIGSRNGSYELFSFAAALAAAPHDDAVLRRTIRRIGLLDRTADFDGDLAVQDRVEEIFAGLASSAPPPAGPPREELLARIAEATAPAAPAPKPGTPARGAANEAVVRRWADGIGRGELTPELIDEELWMKNTPKFPITGPYVGHDGLHQWWRDLSEVFTELAVELTEMTVLDDERVLTTQRLVGKFAATGIDVDVPWASVFWVRDGKIYRIQGHNSRAGALRDAESRRP